MFHRTERSSTADWRRTLLRAVAALLVVKLLALGALKAAFFSGAQPVSAPLVERHLELDVPGSPQDHGDAR